MVSGRPNTRSAPYTINGIDLTAARRKEYSMRNHTSAPIMCLTGSTRFMDAYHEAMHTYSLLGWIVLTVAIPTHGDDLAGVTTEQKKALDELHLRKIDLADIVLVLNVGGYIGESTRAEIEYTKQHPDQKGLVYLEPIDDESISLSIAPAEKPAWGIRDAKVYSIDPDEPADDELPIIPAEGHKLIRQSKTRSSYQDFELPEGDDDGR